MQRATPESSQLHQVSAPDGSSSRSSSRSSVGRGLPSRAIASSSHDQAGSDSGSLPNTAARPQRHVSFNELVHERIFSVLPSPRASDAAALSTDGESDAEVSCTDSDAGGGAEGWAAPAQSGQAGASAQLHSRIILPPLPSPPDSPPNTPTPVSQASIPKSPVAVQAKSKGSSPHGDAGKVTFHSILSGISDGAASHAINVAGGSATEKELRLSHDRIAESLRERLLSITQRLSDLTLLEACHPAGAPLSCLPLRFVSLQQEPLPS